MTKNLNAFQNFQGGFSLSEGIERNNIEKQKAGILQQDLDFKKEQDQRKIQQEEAERQVTIESFNNIDAWKMLMARNPEKAKAVAEMKNNMNRSLSPLIDDVLTAKPEHKQEAWDLTRASLAKGGIDTSDLSKEYTPGAEKMMRQKQKEMRQWDDTFKAIETDRGLMMQSEKTGEITPTGYGVYKKPPTTVINMGDKEENSFYKKFGETKGTEYAEILATSRKSATNISKLNRAESLLKEIGTTGKLTPSIVNLGNIMNQTGLFKIDTKKVADIEELSKLAKDQAGEILASGEYGSGNAISEADLEAANSRVMSADKTVQGNLRIIDTMRRLDQRRVEAGRIVNSMTAKNAPLGDIEQALQDLAAKPLFDDDKKINAPSSSSVNSDKSTKNSPSKNSSSPYGHLSNDELLKKLGG